MTLNSIAVVFPGQGAQKAGMAKDFYDLYAESRDIFQEASDALELDMQELCFTENDKLNLTEYTQPAILTAEIAMLAAIKKNFNFTPKYYGGHSLGEYTALVASGTLAFSDAVKIVRKRGALMQEAVPKDVGAMAALICDNIAETAYEKIVLEAGAEVANFNSLTQVVISGSKESVELSCARLKESLPGINAIMLNVSAPFHCSLMKTIEPAFSNFLNLFAGNINPVNSEQVVSNFSGTFHRADTLLQGLVSQISSSVHWVQNMKTLKETGAEIFEVGPARVLSKFFATIDVSAKSVFNLKTLEKSISGSN